MVMVLFVSGSNTFAASVLTEIAYTKTTTLSYPAKYTILFSLWDDESAGSEVWSEEKTISLTGTKIKTSLGDTIPLTDVDFSQQLWVQVERKKADGTYKVLGLRDRLGVVPYALWSEKSSSSAQGGSVTSVTAGTGLTGGGIGDVTISADIGTAAGTVAAGNHNHDSAYVNVAEPDSITSGMIVDGTVSSGDVGFTYAGSATKGGPATVALALAANGINCPSGQYPLGVDALGNAESCTAAGTITQVVAGSGLTGGGTSGSITVSANLTASGGDNGTATTVARGDHLHSATYVDVTGDTMTGALNVPSIIVPQIATNSPGTNLSISAANGTGDGGDISITAGAAGSSSGGGGGDINITAGWNMPAGGMGYSGLGPPGVVSITAGGGYNTVGGNVTIKSGPTSSWAIPSNSFSKVSIQGGTMDGVNSGGSIEVEGGHSVSGGTLNSQGGNVLLNGGNANGSYPGGSIILAGGTGSTGGGIIIRTNGSKAGCNAANRGMLWYTQGGAGVKDSLEICAKDATDTYAWRALW